MSFSLRYLTHIPSLRIVSLLCCGSRFSNKTFIDAKTKYRSPYLLEASQPYLYKHIRKSLGRLWKTSSVPRQDTSLGVKYYTLCGRPHNVCRRRPQDVGMRPPMALYIGQYGDVLRTLAWDVLRTSYFNVLSTSVKDVFRTLVGDAPWRYKEDHMGTSIGKLLGTSPYSKIRQVDIIKNTRKGFKKGLVKDIKIKNMVENNIKTFLKRKNLGWLSIEKNLIKQEKIKTLQLDKLVNITFLFWLAVIRKKKVFLFTKDFFQDE